MDYSPWSITTTLYNKRGTKIYETTDSRWVLKVIGDETQSLYELQILLRIIADPPRHSIKLPPSLYGLYGRIPTAGWYAMKRYNGCVEVNDFCKTQWQTLAIHVLQFLQDFHHGHGLLHMDIKKANILVDTDKTEFIVADYEHAEPPDPKHTADYDENHQWYYLAMGAEIDEPLYSWRFDLVALGYVLVSLTIEPAAWTFEQECWDRRAGKSGLLYDELVALRTQELSGANSMLCKYLERVATVSWAAKEPPSRQFYKSLEALFLTTDDKFEKFL
jgi:hypothetical protein